MRILFVETFYGGSHRSFADGLVAHSKHEFELLTLPDGEWRQRMRRGAQELAAAAGDLDGEFDLLLATDMLDLTAFLALTRRRFSHTPVMLYFHENQFTYPRIRGTRLNSWFGQINYLSALAADVVAFNSAFHREEFLEALRTLAAQPNNWLVPDAIRDIESRSSALPLGLDLSWLEGPSVRDGSQPPLIVWNSRWEFDKAPDVFARAVRSLADEGLVFRLALCGDPGPNPHPALIGLRDELPDQVVQFGLLHDPAQYAALLRAGDVVVSTSRHEFFGIAMVEAMFAGCLPMAPAGLNYPALVPRELHRRCLYKAEEEFREKLRHEIVERPPVPRDLLREAASQFDWGTMGRQWDAALEAAAACKTNKSRLRVVDSRTERNALRLD